MTATTMIMMMINIINIINININTTLPNGCQFDYDRQNHHQKMNPFGECSQDLSQPIIIMMMKYRFFHLDTPRYT